MFNVNFLINFVSGFKYHRRTQYRSKIKQTGSNNFSIFSTNQKKIKIQKIRSNLVYTQQKREIDEKFGILSG